MPGGMDMQKSNRRVRFGLWFLLFWALAVLAMVLAATLAGQPGPRYDGATFVCVEAGRSYA